MLTIDFSAIQANLATLQKHLPQETEIMAVVKAGAYGTDPAALSQFLSKQCGIKQFAVATIGEAVSLREAGIEEEILVVHTLAKDAKTVAKWNLQAGVSDHETLVALEKQERQIATHLYLDTGMKRFGCDCESALSLARYVMASPHLHLEGVMTHFSSADDPEQDPFTLGQIAQFDALIEELAAAGISPRYRHAAASSGAIRFSSPQYNLVRIGLAMYGIASTEAVHTALPLQPALTLTAPLATIMECRPGDTVSYGRTYRVSGQKRIAVLPIGYHDGLHRCYGKEGYVLLHGKQAPIVGVICMDYTMVDVTHIPEACVGDRVEIFGPDLPVEEVAARGGTIPHELISCLGPRIQRKWVARELPLPV